MCLSTVSCSLEQCFQRTHWTKVSLKRKIATAKEIYKIKSDRITDKK